jgi:transcriptional regulator with XRE-family HTH domain
MTDEGPGTETIGERLRRLRVERGLSQRDISGKGVSFTYISRIESGQRQPSVKALRLLARKLGVTAEYLETGRDLPAASEWELRAADAELGLRLDADAGSESRFGDLLAEAQAASDPEGIDRARVGLALAASQEGRHEEAARALEAVLERSKPSVLERPDLYAALGRTYGASGETPRAVGLFRRCLEEIEKSPSPDPVLYVRFATYLSYALTDAGDSAAANEVLAAAVSRAQGVRDRMTLVRLYWALGRYYAEHGPPARAVEYARRALALLEAGDDTFYLAAAHEAYATVLLDQATRPDEAEEHLDAAERLYGSLSEPGYVGSARVERARLALLRGDPDGARERALEALDLLDRGGEEIDTGRAWRALAEVFGELDDPELAERCFQTAIERVTAQGVVKELAETHRAHGKFLRARGRETEALDAYEKAADLSARTVTRPVGRSGARVGVAAQRP